MRNRVAQQIDPFELCRIRFSRSEKESLRRLAECRDVADQKAVFRYLSAGVGVSQNRRFILEMADRLIPSRSENVRWGTCTWLLGDDDYVKSHPALVWPLVVKWGSVRSEDIRRAIACCVLEHLLQFHFVEYFPKVRKLIEEGNKRSAWTLSCCYKLGEAEKPENAQLIDSFLDNLKANGVRLQEVLRTS